MEISYHPMHFSGFVLFNLEFSVQCLADHYLCCPFSFILIKLYVFTK
jgi:hypothetical protein